MRATSPAGDASFEGVVQWTADLGEGVRAPEAGQSENRDDVATGSKQIREVFYRHLQPEDVPLDRRGLQGLVRQAKEKIPEGMLERLPRRHRGEK
jgi:hypothetical protein